jgi:SRSO17 transposase
MAELRQHVAQERGNTEAVLVVDGSGFPKKGTASCGVARQWCGRLGKVDNCQVGVFLAYVTEQGYAPLDRQLYLPREWAANRPRRQATHVPKEVKFQESWRIALGLIDRSGADVPFGWVAADDEFGRPTAFREALRCRELRYVLDVPSNTLIRDLDAEATAGRRVPPWRSVDAWAQAQPSARWRKVTIGDGAKGPKVVRVLEGMVQTKDEHGRAGMAERLVVLRTVDREPQTWYTLSNAPRAVPVERIAAVHGRRHGVEELFQASKGEVGLGHYEVRSWVGWHHHMTLSLLALWFLVLEKGRVGKKNPGLDGAAAARSVHALAASGAGQPESDSGGGQPRLTPKRRGAHLPLVLHHQEIPAEAGVARTVERLQ